MDILQGIKFQTITMIFYRIIIEKTVNGIQIVLKLWNRLSPNRTYCQTEETLVICIMADWYILSYESVDRYFFVMRFKHPLGVRVRATSEFDTTVSSLIMFNFGLDDFMFATGPRRWAIPKSQRQTVKIMLKYTETELVYCRVIPALIIN